MSVEVEVEMPECQEVKKEINVARFKFWHENTEYTVTRRDVGYNSIRTLVGDIQNSNPFIQTDCGNFINKNQINKITIETFTEVEKIQELV
jgi:hypothetical protein